MPPEFSRRDLISGPYWECPNPKGCHLSIPSFGVFVSVGGGHSYTRECYVCGYSKSYDLPQIRKKIIYLDQFIFSNLLILIDKEHSRHQKAISNSSWRNRWERMFVALESALHSQAIICPDSFTHRHESLLGTTTFALHRKMYEHFSGGNTLYRSVDIQRFQLVSRFRHWILGSEYVPDMRPEAVCQQQLHTWSFGLRVAVNLEAFPGEIENLTATKHTTEERMRKLWAAWSTSTDDFDTNVKEETNAIGRSLVEITKAHNIKLAQAMESELDDTSVDFLDLFPPPATDTLVQLMQTARAAGIEERKIAPLIANFFTDTSALLEVPKVKISSIMFAGLARKAQLGQKKVPKSLADIDFISSYLPYCDAMFLDKESAELITALPKGTRYRLDEYKDKIYSLNSVDDFINYLDKIISNLSTEHKRALSDVQNRGYEKPCWNLIANERQKLTGDSS